MNIVVLAKYIPDPNATPDIGEDFRVKREGVEGALDPGDEFAVEAALQLVDQAGGEVTVVSMGPTDAMTAIRKALSMGCHKGVLITDDALKGADVLVTAKVLAGAIQLQEFDLVLTGVESTDGSTGTLPMSLAEYLGVPSGTFARKLDLADGKATIERQTEAGYDVVECPLPALVSVTAGVNEPRYPKLKEIMAAKNKPIDQLSAADLGFSAEDLQPTQTVASIEPAPERAAGEVIQAADAPAKIVSFLKEAKLI
ncbi:MAG: electron transfer flavoprotein subunit beta/FixA family protein [Actinomycetota bacterium]